jgi:hypothetical protein
MRRQRQREDPPFAPPARQVRRRAAQALGQPSGRLAVVTTGEGLRHGRSI